VHWQSVDGVDGSVTAACTPGDDHHRKAIPVEVNRQPARVRFDAAFERVVVGGQDEHARLWRRRLFSHGV
jgi:hypothetical protein